MWRKATIGELPPYDRPSAATQLRIIAQAAQAEHRAPFDVDPTRRADAVTDGDHRGGHGKATRPVATSPRRIWKVKDFQHAEWVTKGDSNTYVTHEAILGEVTAVSSSSITVRSTDGTSMTFAVAAGTKVHQRQTKGSTTTTPTIADIKTGQTVLVGGEKSPDLTAQNIVARAT